ncbi:FtsX-like permease family protein [Paenibacillus sp. TRM 82003]|uniref:FtsX-like permease family protein n=1 Tax=Kineococcus sp. TRM81007 TaxID=2925831 RepID=UPI001F59880C|nr:FtsX-like permease family protein [Kineococcus sp. TRM81007]MCI2239395.1 FtsX-like permease family protein [Kineococcus sp. TRM81007]MCI3925077.1 FtsX-like permease family protein [Paenibacillus sp. TRM 82003]
MLRTTLAQLRAHAGRVLASCLAVVIAVAFVVATLVLNSSASASLLKAVGAPFVASAAVVTAAEAAGPDTAGAALREAAERVRTLPGVGQVAADREASVQARLPGYAGSTYAQADAVTARGPLRWERASSGRLPQAPGEVAVSEGTGVGVGEELGITVPPLEEGAEDVTEQVRVVGVVDMGGDPTAGLLDRVFAVDADLQRWGADAPSRLRVAAAAGADAGELTALVEGAVDGTLVVRTGEEAAEDAAAAFTGDAAAITSVLLVFAAVAVLVAGLVIANTFAVLLAQRTRDLALLRCVGATRAQTARSVLLEAAVVGVLASLAGAAAGVGLAAVVSRIAADADSPIPLDTLEVPAHALVVGVVLGTLVTVLAALAPARASTRVAPLAALRPLAPAPVRSRGGLLRLVAGLVLTVPSAVALVWFAARGVLEPAVLAGAVSFVGVVLLSQRAVPVVVGLAGRLVRGAGTPARLAAGNAVRNPRRTAATATALLIGVTLTTAMVVGASSTRATAGGLLAAEFPADVTVSADVPLGAGVLAELEGLEQVAALAPVLDGLASGPGGDTVEVVGVDPAQAAGVLRSEQRLPLPVPGQLVVSTDGARWLGVRDGGTATLLRPDGTEAVPLQVVLDPQSQQPAVATAADVRRADPQVAAAAAWLRLADDLDAGEQGAAVDAVTEVAAEALPTSRVDGIVAVREAFDQVLTTMLLVVTGLLGVAVVIALIGVGNTLALSVVERRQESGLLRALGLTRGQLRALLAWEALLVAGVAGVLGVALGTGYGLAGTASVLAAEGPVVLDVPWTSIAGIVVVAALAGVLASVLPARRAARTPPVAAIAG